MRGRLLVLLASLLALVVLLPGAVVSTAAAGAGTAHLSPTVQQWLATAGSGSTIHAIVTFDSRTTLSKIDGLNVGAMKLSSLPIALATLSAAQVRQVASWREVVSV